MFITAKSRIEQTDINGYWRTIDNELCVSNNKVLLCPRYLWTDGYTFPGIIMPFIGDKNKFDVRPAHIHDLMCRFHEVIVVNLTISQLMELGYLKEYNNKIICEDIPIEYLTIEKVNKKYCDDLLKELMLYCGVKKFTTNIIRFGVIFNLNWYFRTGKRSLNSYELFKEDIGLVNGL